MSIFKPICELQKSKIDSAIKKRENNFLQTSLEEDCVLETHQECICERGLPKQPVNAERIGEEIREAVKSGKSDKDRQRARSSTAI